MDAEQLTLDPAVRGWLTTLGLAGFEPLFLQQQILSLALAAEVLEADLEQWGVQPVPRRVLLRAIGELKERLEAEGGERIDDSDEEEDDESYSPSVRSNDDEIDEDFEVEVDTERIRIFVKTLVGEITEFNIPDDTTVLELKHAYWQHEGVPVDLQRLIFAGRQLEDHRTLWECSMTNATTIHLVNRLRGGCVAAPVPAIFEFLVDRKNEFLPTAAPLNASVDTVAAASSVAIQLGGQEALHHSPECRPDAILLDGSQRQALIRLMDARHVASGGTDADLRFTVSGEELAALVGPDALGRLEAAFGGTAYDTIRLRRVSADVSSAGRLVPFHVDYSRRTMQVALNEEGEYDGGQVVFCTSGGFVVAPRPAGSYSVHTNHIVHGVTALTRGVRYSMFLCNTSTLQDVVGETEKTEAIEDLTSFLLQAVPAEMAFLADALTFLDHTTDGELADIIDGEYKRWFWNTDRSVEPVVIGARIAWRTHMLSPVQYIAMCNEGGAQGAASKWSTSELIALIRRQQAFMAKVAELAKDGAETFEGGIQEYVEFFSLLSQVGEDTELEPPSTMADLAWHVHMQNPHRYGPECLSIVGRVVDHSF